MRFNLAYSSAAVAGLFGVAVHAAEPQLVFKDRSYYSYGYAGNTTEGVPNG